MPRLPLMWCLWCAPAVVLAQPVVEETGPTALGVSGAVTARALGPTSLGINPAGMAVGPGLALDVGGAARLSVFQAGTPPRSVDGVFNSVRRDARSALGVEVPPAVFGSFTRGPLTLGAGVHAGLLHAPRLPDSNSAVRVWLAQAGLAWRQGPVRVGAALVAAAGWHTAGTSGPGLGVGALAGVTVDAHPRVSVGAAFQTRVGLAFANAAPGAAWPGCVTRPQSCGGPWSNGPDALLADRLRVGLAWRALDTTLVTVDAGLTLWGLLGSQAALLLSSPGVRLRDTLTLRAGVEQALFFLGPDLTARVGTVYAQSPVPWGKASAALPYGDTLGVSAGVGWRIFGVTVDAGYQALLGLPREGQGGTYYRGTTHMLGAGVGYRMAP